ncbi:NPP1 domain-containing protein [Colletotrichum camelliae]|nr:NPP1 domain-containing protein [Colletotrichum camelliae]
MLHPLFSSLVFLGLTSLASSSVLNVRNGDIAVGNKWKPHDQVAIFQQEATDGLDGVLELRFKPVLNDASGCFPYAAVDKDGNHGMGLKPTGKSGGSCRDDSKGQLYARVGTSHGRTGVMYSWYLPKVQTDTERHKHWYLSIIVWLYSAVCDPVADDYHIVGLSYSNAKETYDASASGGTLYSSGDSGTGPGNTHPVVGYNGQVNVFPSKDGAQYALSPPLVSWQKLSLAAREQLNGIQYEHARCPFNDGNFQASLDAAYNRDFYTNLAAERDDCKPDAPIRTPTPTPAPSSGAKEDDGSTLDETDAEAIIKHMTTRTFLRYIKGEKADLTDTCVFYTKGVSTAGAATGLSSAATEWACRESQKPRYTIWNLFPNAFDASTHPGVRDFYAMFTPGSWLDPIRKKQEEFEATLPPGVVPPSIRYFQKMSEAMAEACYGDIIIMTETPSELALYEPGKKYQDARFSNIFWSHERPVLQRKVKAGEAKLYVLDSNTKEAWEITDITTFELGPSVKFRRDLPSAYETSDIFGRSLLQARDNMCQRNGLGSQRPGQDWFGSYGSNGW